MKCKSCGKEVEEGTRRCTACGGDPDPWRGTEPPRRPLVAWWTLGACGGALLLFLVLCGPETWHIFASAREKAAMSNCASNHNLMIRAAIMYCNDNNDRLPPVTRRGFGDPAWGSIEPGRAGDVPWPILLRRYYSSEDILVCPRDDRADRLLDPRTNRRPDDLTPARERLCRAYRTNIGYNYIWLSSSTGRGRMQKWDIAQQSYVGAPAATVLFVDTAWSKDENGRPVGGGAFVVDAPAPQPDRKVNKPAGWDGWQCRDIVQEEYGKVSDQCLRMPSGFGHAVPLHPEGYGFTVSFLDGHVKRLRAADLVAGCDWRTGEITDWDKFMWDTYQ